MSTSSFLEVEAKFSVTASTPIPDLTRIPQVAAVGETTTQELSAIYYDTEDLRLTRNKVTLRRRTGGKDDGWHIKLPGDMGRTEIRAELGEPVDGAYQVPEELLHEVRSIIRRHRVEPIAQVDNTRTESQLVDAQGQPVAEFCDDHVTAWSLLPGGAQTTWREWEIELAGDLPGTGEGTELIHTATSLLIGAGARVSNSPSKLVAALGASIDNAPLPPALLTPDVDDDSPAAAVVAALQANRDKLVEYDPKVRRDEWDSVHQMRVATRELRSHIQTFHGIVSGPEIERIENELKVLAGMLGVARDAEVVEERWQLLLAREDSDVLDDTTREHISDDMGKAYRRAHRRVVAALDSDRYLDLLESLDLLLANPPVGKPESNDRDLADADADENDDSSAPASDLPASDLPASSAPASDDTEPATGAEESPSSAPAEQGHDEVQDMEKIMAQHLNGAYEKLVKRHKKAVSNWDNPQLSLQEREEYFHDMRKAAKKLRYAAEAAGSATKLKTKGVYKACKEMQSILGDFQDSVTSRDKLLELAAAARRRGEDTFGYGLLYQRERAIGLEALENYEACMKKVTEAFKPLKKKLKK